MQRAARAEHHSDIQISPHIPPEPPLPLKPKKIHKKKKATTKGKPVGPHQRALPDLCMTVPRESAATLKSISRPPVWVSVVAVCGALCSVL